MCEHVCVCVYDLSSGNQKEAENEQEHLEGELAEQADEPRAPRRGAGVDNTRRHLGVRFSFLHIPLELTD